MQSQHPLRGTRRHGYFDVLLYAGLCLLGSGLPVTSPAAASDPASVTIQSNRAGRAELQRQADQYVEASVVHHFGEPLMRWDGLVCPMVAGLPRDQGEFVLQRLSQSMHDAGVPLAPQNCTANFVVIVSSRADQILAELQSKAPRLFDTQHGVGGLQHFMLTKRPIRVWYNWENRGETTAGLAVIAALIGGGPSVGGTLGPVTSAAYTDWPSNRLPNSHLSLTVSKSINTAVIVVDRARMKGVNVAQLSDYTAMVGLAEINLDRSVDSAPTVLRLFNEPSEAPLEGMSSWDRALLKSLYGTRALSVMQVSEMETQVAKSMSPH
jgi:hypothetical protein